MKPQEYVDHLAELFKLRMRLGDIYDEMKGAEPPNRRFTLAYCHSLRMEAGSCRHEADMHALANVNLGLVEAHEAYGCLGEITVRWYHVEEAIKEREALIRRLRKGAR